MLAYSPVAARHPDHRCQIHTEFRGQPCAARGLTPDRRSAAEPGTAAFRCATSSGKIRVTTGHPFCDRPRVQSAANPVLPQPGEMLSIPVSRRASPVGNASSAAHRYPSNCPTRTLSPG